MQFNDYQKMAYGTAQYPDRGSNLLYPALGIAEEAGEVAGKVKKFWRNLGITDGAKLDEGQKEVLKKELGDVLWYAAAIATEIGETLDTIAHLNLNKLYDRQERGVIKGEGDNR